MMAGDWIKVEKSTPRKPEVLRIACHLGIDPDRAFGLCFRFWCWCDDHLENGNALGVTKELLDTLLGVTGFADALLEVDWLQARSGSLVIPHFDRHLSQSAKNRALTAQRVASHKQRKGNDASVTSALPREEKRRDINKNNAREIPKRFNTPEVLAALEDWARHYEDKHGDQFTFTVRDNLLMDKARLGWDAAKLDRCIRASIAAGAKSIFDADESRSRSQHAPPGSVNRQEPQYRQLTPPQRPRKESA